MKLVLIYAAVALLALSPFVLADKKDETVQKVVDVQAPGARVGGTKYIRSHRQLSNFATKRHDKILV